MDIHPVSYSRPEASRSWTRTLSRLLVLTIALSLLTAVGAATTITVDDDDGENYTTIQDAINNANTGDTVVVNEGTYSSFQISSSITGLTIEPAEGETPTIEASSSGIELSDGTTVRGLDIDLLSGQTIYTKADNLELLNNHITISGSSNYGVRVGGATGALIEGNTFVQQASSDTPQGILLAHNDDAVVRGNVFTGVDSGQAVLLSNNGGSTNNILIEKNNVTGFKNGIFLFENENEINGVTVQNNKVMATDGVDVVAFDASGGDGFTDINSASDKNDQATVLLDNNDIARASVMDVTVAADILVVDEDNLEGDFNSIQGAVDASNSGGTIEVADGTYNQVVINRDTHASGITIQASDGASPAINHDASNGEPAVAVDQDGIRIEGFTIQRTGSSSNVAQAIRVAGDDVDLVDNTYEAAASSDAAVAVFTDSSGAAGNPEFSGEVGSVEIDGGTIKNSDTGVLIADSGAASFGEDAVGVRNVDFDGNGFILLELIDSGAVDRDSFLDNNDFDQVASPETAQGTLDGFEVKTVVTTSIQDAVGYAANGTTVEVGPGTYTESIDIGTSGLTLTSTGDRDETTIEAPADTTNLVKIQPSADEATIEGFTLTGAERRGIFVGDYTNENGPEKVSIQDNHIKNIGDVSEGLNETHGILVEQGADQSVVKDNLIELIDDGGDGDNNAVGLSMVSQDAGGLHSVEVTGNTIRGIKADEGGGEESKAKGIEMTGKVVDATITDNEVANIGDADTTKKPRGIAILEHDDVGGETVGPTNFEITGNTFDNINTYWAGDGSPGVEGAATVFIGNYDDMGVNHEMSNNNFLDGIVRNCCGNEPMNLNATDNYWGAASGPAHEGAGTGVNVSTNVSFRPWLLQANGDQYDQTIAIAEADWTLVSPDRELAEQPTIDVDGDGSVEDRIIYEGGEWVSPGSTATHPLAAHYVKTTDPAGIGVNYVASGDMTSEVSRDLSEGWNLVGSRIEDTPVDAFGSLGPSDQTGLELLFVPGAENVRKDSGKVHSGLPWESHAGQQFGASNLPTEDVARSDGYWAYLSGDRTYTQAFEP